MRVPCALTDNLRHLPRPQTPTVALVETLMPFAPAAMRSWTDAPRSSLYGHLTSPHRYAVNAELPADLSKDGLLVVLDGIVAHCVWAAPGKRRIVGLLMAGDLCCERVAADRNEEWFVALTACRAASLPGAHVHHLTQGCPSVARALWRAAVQSAAIEREWLRNDARSAPERLAHRVCEILTRHDKASAFKVGASMPHIRQTAWADMTAMTVVHVNRCFKQMHNDGLIRLHRGGVAIPDLARLIAFAEFEPGYLRLDARLAMDELGQAVASRLAAIPT